ncbi:MAG TPA: selenide, water dikinase SelD, partial [Verrucomicrobiae bacterium]|nr:selenide, water dikinase SelD [Verrucomicrobiae bacterium]
VDAAGAPEEELLPLFDPQTSGGLLITLSPDEAAAYLRRAAAENLDARLVGEVVPSLGSLLRIR